MKATLRAAVLTLMTASACTAWSSLKAQASPRRVGNGPTVDACSLLTKAEVEALTGRHFYTEPDLTQLRGGGTACTYDDAQIMVFSGPNSEESFNSLLAAFGHGNEVKHPVLGFGEGAYIIYPTPRDKYEGNHGVLVAKVTSHTLAISLEAEGEKPAESVRPALERFARAVLDKVR
jgi:hypothetical protein